MYFINRCLFLFFIAILLSSCTDKRQPAISEDLSIAATINIKDMTISFIDLKRLEKLADWQMDKPYTGAIIFPDGDTILFYGKQAETADLYSLKKGKMTSSWETGTGIVNGILLHNESEIALVDQNQNKIRFFNLEGKEVAKVNAETSPLTILEAVDSKKLYVLSFNNEKLTVIDLKNKEKTLGFAIHPSAAGAWLNEEKNELWVGGHGQGAEIEKDIHVYDSDTGKFKKKIAAPSMPVNFLGLNNNVYVLSHGSSKLYKLNEKGEVLNSIVVGANPFEIETSKSQLMIAGYDSNDFHIVDPGQMVIKKTIKVGSGPFEIILRERE